MTSLVRFITSESREECFSGNEKNPPLVESLTQDTVDILDRRQRIYAFPGSTGC